MLKKPCKELALFIVLLMAIPYFSFAITNGDFEAGTVGSAPPNWLGYSLGSLTTGSGARTGGAGTKIITGNNPAGGGSIYQTEAAITGALTYPQTWRISGWVRIDNATNFNFGWFGSASPYGPSSDNISTAPTLNTWTLLTVIHTWSTPSTFSDGWRDAQVNFQGTIDMDDWETQNQTVDVADWCFY